MTMLADTAPECMAQTRLRGGGAPVLRRARWTAHATSPSMTAIRPAPISTADTTERPLLASPSRNPSAANARPRRMGGAKRATRCRRIKRLPGEPGIAVEGDEKLHASEFDGVPHDDPCP